MRDDEACAYAIKKYGDNGLWLGRAPSGAVLILRYGVLKEVISDTVSKKKKGKK